MARLGALTKVEKSLGVRSFYTAYHSCQLIKGNKSFPDFNQGSLIEKRKYWQHLNKNKYEKPNKRRIFTEGNSGFILLSSQQRKNIKVSFPRISFYIDFLRDETLDRRPQIYPLFAFTLLFTSCTRQFSSLISL